MIPAVACSDCLLAKGGDWVTVAAMAIGFIIWLFTQLAGQGAKTAQKRKQPPRPQPPQRPVPPSPPRVPPATAARPPVRRPGRPTPPPRRKPARAGKRPQPPRRSVGTLQERPAQGKKKLSSLENRHLETSIKPQVTSLPEGTVPSDLEIHVEQEFAHHTGELPSEQRTEAQQPPSALSPVAQEIINTLRNPQDVRKAVVIAEILRRPEF